jgi:hypothetical protein
VDLRNYQQIAHFIHFRRHVVAPLEVSYPVTPIELKTANILREKTGKWGLLYTTTTILDRGNKRRSGGLCQRRLRSGIIRYDFGSSLMEVARPNLEKWMKKLIRCANLPEGGGESVNLLHTRRTPHVGVLWPDG